MPLEEPAPLDGPNEPEEEIPAAQSFMLSSPASSIHDKGKASPVVDPNPEVRHFPQIHFHFGDYTFDSNHSPNFNLLKCFQVW